MKKYLLLSVAVLFFATFAAAQKFEDNSVEVKNVTCQIQGDKVLVKYDLDLSGLEVPTRRAVVLTPKLVNGEQSQELPSVAVYGRQLYYSYLRQNGEGLITGKGEQSYRASERPSYVNYSQTIDYKLWMDNSKLILEKKCYACCNKQTDAEALELASLKAPEKFTPVFLGARTSDPVLHPHTLTVHMDYKLGSSEIIKTFGGNAGQMEKIQELLDALKDGRHGVLRSFTITGYASPEGSYNYNAALAEKRSRALKNYVTGLLGDAGIEILTSSVAEDWDGVKNYVEASGLKAKTEILDIINGNQQPDAKNDKIKRLYPTDYAKLKKDCYPALRRAEIEVVCAEVPADVVKKQEEEFNVNMANSAMKAGNLAQAKEYLSKAGESYEAQYARGLFEVLSGNKDKAAEYFNSVKNVIPEAAAALKQLEALK